jgi:hypothetical protein
VVEKILQLFLRTMPCLALHRLHVLPSIALHSRPQRSSCLHRRVNARHTRLRAWECSWRKSARVLQSGVSFRHNHITSSLRWLAGSSLRLERSLFQEP